jgi:hypothetical protein
MIKLFRGIRKNLLSKNTLGKYDLLAVRGKKSHYCRFFVAISINGGYKSNLKKK